MMLLFFVLTLEFFLSIVYVWRINKCGTIEVECDNCKAQLLIKPKNCFISRDTINKFGVICPRCKGVSLFNRGEVPYTFYRDIRFADTLPPKYDSPVPNEPVLLDFRFLKSEGQK